MTTDCPSVCEEAGMSCFNWSQRYVDRPDRGNRWQRDMPKVIWHATVGSAGFETQPFFFFFCPFPFSLFGTSCHLLFLSFTSISIPLYHILLSPFLILNPAFSPLLLAMSLTPPFLPFITPFLLNLGHKASCTGCCLSLLKHTAP